MKTFKIIIAILAVLLSVSIKISEPFIDLGFDIAKTDETVFNSETKPDLNKTLKVQNTEEKTDADNKEGIANRTEIKDKSAKEDKDITPDKKLFCTVSISCKTIFENIDKFDKEKIELLPADGIILKETPVEFKDGENVFDILKKVTRENKIHLEYVKAPGSESYYIEGINNIYEFDCGDLSGWLFRVNGEVPSFGSWLYKIKENDKIEWIYTCNSGKDINNGKE